MGESNRVPDAFLRELQAMTGSGDTESTEKLARDADAEGKVDSALLAYHALANMSPETGVLPLASLLWRQGNDPADAEYILRLALRSYSASRQRQAWSRELGDLIMAQKSWGEAERAYLEGLAGNSEDWVLHIGLGWLDYERGDGLDEALEEFRTAVRLDPHQGEGYLAIGQALVREGRFASADPWFEQALELNQGNRWWYIYRGDNARNAGNLSLALQIYEHALSLFPDFAHGYFEISWTYRLMDDPDRSIEAIERALALSDVTDEWTLARA